MRKNRFNPRHSILLILFLAACSIPSKVSAQKSPLKSGVELDFLPYALKGYFGAVWAGKDQWRVRALHARVKMPGFLDPDGLENNWIHSTAVLLDYFPEGKLEKWWIGAGPVLHNGRIEAKNSGEQATYHSYLLNGSAGYIFPLGKHLYCSPWAGLSLRIAGDKDIPVGDQTYDPPFLNPELSFKVGYMF